ncbi:MAG: DUF4126 domain-containing protein [Ahniella sp.]|nr:DUF4126 domain-containing protein [Ahniella sp.]
MNELVSPVTAFALGITLAWLAGMRVYLTVFGVGLAGVFGWMPIPESMDVVMSPWILALCLTMAIVEFFADKLPGVDSIWDLAHTLVRIPAGAFVGGLALSDGNEMSQTGMLAGGAVALLAHSLKSGTRALVNHSPEPVSNATVSSTEDVISLSGLALVFAHPFLSMGLLLACAATLVLMLWLAKAVLQRLFASPVLKPA